MELNLGNTEAWQGGALLTAQMQTRAVQLCRNQGRRAAKAITEARATGDTTGDKFANCSCPRPQGEQLQEGGKNSSLTARGERKENKMNKGITSLLGCVVERDNILAQGEAESGPVLVSFPSL